LSKLQRGKEGGAISKLKRARTSADVREVLKQGSDETTKGEEGKGEEAKGKGGKGEGGKGEGGKGEGGKGEEVKDEEVKGEGGESSTMTCEAFIEEMTPSSANVPRDLAAEAFKIMDVEGAGCISIRDLRVAARECCPDEVVPDAELLQMIQSADVFCTGVINEECFQAYFFPKPEEKKKKDKYKTKSKSLGMPIDKQSDDIDSVAMRTKMVLQARKEAEDAAEKEAEEKAKNEAEEKARAAVEEQAKEAKEKADEEAKEEEARAAAEEQASNEARKAQGKSLFLLACLPVLHVPTKAYKRVGQGGNTATGLHRFAVDVDEIDSVGASPASFPLPKREGYLLKFTNRTSKFRMNTWQKR
jgi:hypothetical protein